MSDSLWPHELYHARLPCPSPSPGVCSNSCPVSQWCHPTILSSVTPFFFCPQSFPAVESFPMSWLFASGSQSIGASTSVLPMNIQGWFLLGLTGLISLQSKGLSRVFKHINSSALSLLHGPTLTFVHDYWKNQSLDYMDTVTRGTYPNSSAQAPLWKVLLCPDILLIHWGRYHWITVPFPDPSQILPCGIQKARLFFYWLRYSKSQDRIY